jgi:uncharacterized protein YbaR (Trm112 family)
MPSIVLPLVKPEIGTNIFTCPQCRTRCDTHRAFVEHFSAAHVAEMTPPQRGPIFTPTLSPQPVGGAEVACPVCNKRLPGSDYEQHSKIHAGGGITAAAFNQEAAK